MSAAVINLTDLPRFISAQEYDVCIKQMIQRVSSFPGVVSIYQIGGVSSYGISDLDFFVFFKHNEVCMNNPLADLNNSAKYLFCHNLFGTSVNYLEQIEKYTLFSNYKLLWGDELSPSKYFTETEETKFVKQQIALEYLLKAFISLTIEINYGIIKVRNLLLHAKALKTDFVFLNITEKEINETLSLIISWRDSWFTAPPSDNLICETAIKLHQQIEIELMHCFNSIDFYFPCSAKKYNLSSNILLKNNKLFNIKQSGLKKSSSFLPRNKTGMKLRNKLNTFNVNFPWVAVTPHRELSERYSMIKEALQYNQKNLRYFLPTAYGMRIFD